MVRPILALVPSIYKKGKLYSVLPRDGSGDFSTSRGLEALRVNSLGESELMGIDVPRIDYSLDSCPSLLTGTSDSVETTYPFNSLVGELNIEFASLSNTIVDRTISLSDGTLNNHLSISIIGNNSIRFDFVVNGVSQVSHTEVVTDATALNKVKFSYRLGEFIVEVNEVVVFTQFSGDVPADGSLTELKFSNPTGGDKFLGFTKSLMFFSLITEDYLQYKLEKGL